MVILMFGTNKIISMPATLSKQEVCEHHYFKSITEEGKAASRTVIWFQLPLSTKQTNFFKFISVVIFCVDVQIDLKHLLQWRDMGWCCQTVACWIVAKYWATCATDRAWWSAVIPTTIWNYLSCYVKSGDQPIGNTPPQHIGKVISSNIIYKYELTLVVRLQRGWFCELNKKAFVC